MTPDEVTTTLRTAGCVWAEDEAALLIDNFSTVDALAAAVRRRVGGEPLELVLGWADFHGLRIMVAPGVFIPRRRTEFLAEQAISSMRRHRRPVVVELCCGAGAISRTLLSRPHPPVELHASDIDPGATKIARVNLLGATLQSQSAPADVVQVHTGDLFEPLPGRLHGRVDLVVANVPYVPTGQLEFLPSEARDFEPRLALDGGDDGLAVFRRLAGEVRTWLAPGGQVMSEVSRDQSGLAQILLTAQGLTARTRYDEAVQARIVIGTLSD